LRNIHGDKKPVMFVNHTVKLTDRLRFIELVKKSTTSTIVASMGTSSTGLNIPNLNNLICACQVKTEIEVIQFVGRGLRINDQKDSVKIYDIGDDLSSASKDNTTLSRQGRREQFTARVGLTTKLFIYNKLHRDTNKMLSKNVLNEKILKPSLLHYVQSVGGVTSFLSSLLYLFYSLTSF
jgi:superfamily II DNA or RNA helicase